eukprot:TRINITY_DN18855_c0_g1_i1.p2 TRINITY_DN18855_c0_g1~~TRINITY_DN18855_c0_g1_i1.p2  ORF type:complete len:515 (+),score=105.32 TRINITY_DN18855_c0_g1_i1:2268-3812(+)
MALHKVSLAEEMLREEFGELAANAGHLLLYKGKLTFPALQRELRVEPRKLQICLQLLITHNVCATWRATRPEADLYGISADDVVVRLRFARFAQLARELFSEDGEFVVLEFATYGRLSRTDVLSLLRQRFPSATTRNYELRLNEMLKQGFIHRAPELQEPQEGGAPESGFPDKKRKRDAPTVAPTPPAATTATDEPGKKRRKKKDGEEATMPQETGNAHEPASAGADTLGNRAQDCNLYCLNYAQFVMHLRNADVVRLAEQKARHVGSQIVRSMLEAGTPRVQSGIHSVTNLPRGSGGVALSTLARKLQVAPESLEGALRLLEKCGMAHTQAVGREPVYGCSVDEACRQLRMRAVEGVVFNKFGTMAARMFRILLDKRLAEERRIAELGLMPLPKVREMAYRMYISGYIHMQEVPKSADRSLYDGFFLWGVDLDRVQTLVRDHTYGAIRHMRTKLLTEKAVLVAKGVSPAMFEAEFEGATAEQRLLLDKWSQTEKVLLNAILQLDQFVMVLESY